MRQWGHLASALFNVLNRKVSWQCAHVTRHIPGTLFGATEPPLAGVVGLGARLMIRLQFGLGQAMRWDVALQISRQLQGQRTYLRPGGALRIGVASLHSGHFTTCWSFLPDMSIIFWHTWNIFKNSKPISCSSRENHISHKRRIYPFRSALENP